MNYFEFKHVGQGLFYTGTIMNEYNFVFDCGSSNDIGYIKKEINNMKLPNGSHNINFVVISHLHNDHFNGLPLLLAKFKIDKVYLPYLGEDKTLIQFILAKEILGAGLEVQYTRRLYSLMCCLYGIDLEVDNFTYREEYIPHVDFLGYIQRNNDMLNNKIGYGYRKYLKDSDKEVTKSYEEKEEHFLWKFVFINRTFSNKKMRHASEVINNYFVRFSDDGKVTPEVIHRTVKSKVSTLGGLKELENVYSNAFGGNKNITSTILIHYPKMNSSGMMIGTYEDVYSRWSLSESFRADGNITVLTGDAEFNRDMVKVVDLFLKGRQGGLLQVPHHGSYSNWKMLKNIPNKFSAFIIPVGHNGYGHPDEKISDDIYRIKCKPYINCATEVKGIYYYI